ncbi:MAG: hypothetical protein UU64_C0007G0023 [candidate division WWE3 bacterium GW2011_GWF2_41_45]|uniref:HTH merR-type domain-containing protein n=3 Tax=Katanobacteria TaxID=422282 RepID=A0A1F4VZH6_UNCKA|nr:MAG: hypothetical protein UU55_C0011G0018 [candidate division WWE3 bacterium GW2011_GWC2_41_23]KKS10210.1 MAG: hypothetical protein UU64_C0007G0023 [candidate division WWE3 bacterium GW2011_GWF2_41_45]KKS19552.1 MAG: hypothetical protein UU79_C0016G0019 [candidate division WWE3 bacterium GW2011_GWE1_41_72]KKS28418.1 MAG: hypothetical protein UU90_C0028G0011 [candidate division WWE3 bacterium GW2011_GWD2_42_11]KKS50498.1 MAG: hypothetical protein UV16_C0010G0007 [candidate division WWE3 bacte
MEKMLSTEELILKAQSTGIDFGKGDPYNRLRYYTKIGWLPHMTRQKDSDGNIRGHYPDWVLERLVTIERLKAEGADNDEIAKEIETKNKYTNLLNVIKSKEIRTQLISYSTLILLLIISANEFGLINIGNKKSSLIEAFSAQGTNSESVEIVASGSAVVPKGHSSVFVDSEILTADAKVIITFTQSFSPATAYWVTNVRAGEGFELRLDTPLYYDTSFNWFVSK